MAGKGFGLALALLVALTAWLYDRSTLLRTFYDNHPSRLVRFNGFKSQELKFADKVRSCEDVMLLQNEGLALLACDAGRERWNTVMGVFVNNTVPSAGLFLYDYKDASADLQPIKLVGFAGQNDFHTLGMSLDEASSTLFVVNHAKAGSRVEKFKLDATKRTATHLGTIQHPLIRSPNALVAIDEHSFYVTNDHRFVVKSSWILSKLETFGSLPLGTLLRVTLDAKNAVKQADVLARAPFANGIEMLDKDTLVLASTTMPGFIVFNVQADGSLKEKTRVYTPFLADNLSVDGDKLMVAGHPHFPALARFSATRHICNDEAEHAKASVEMKAYCEDTRAHAPSAVAEWSEKGGLKMLYVDTEYPSSAMAVRDSKRNFGMVAGLYAKGVLVWQD